MISKRAQKVDSSGIRKVFELGAKMQNPVNLSIGQPDFDVPEELKEIAIEQIKKGFNRYTLTQGVGDLRDKIGEYINKTRNKSYQSDEIIVTSGVSGGLMLVLMSILDPLDEVIFFDPYFVMYKHLVNLIGGVPVEINSYPDFSVNEASLRKAITPKTKAILLNTPSNPTGYVMTRADIDTIIKAAKENDILIISDEIYDGFVYDGKFESPASYYDNVVLLGGYSKTYAMTGWRLGYAAGPREIIAQMIKLQQYSFVCAPAPFQMSAIAALDLDISEIQAKYKAKRDLIYEGLKDSFNIVKPRGSFYIFPGLKQGDASKFVEKAINNSVLIIPGNVFSEQNTHFRISFAASDETLKKGIDILNRIAK